jgi:UDP-glucose 4-epimerase
VFGGDYPTAGGTGIRDYIYVMDLGTGKGYSVHEMIQAFEIALRQQVLCKIIVRQAGGVAACYADLKKAGEVLNWTARAPWVTCVPVRGVSSSLKG